MPNCREIRKAVDAASKRSELAPDVELHLVKCAECQAHATSNFQLLSLLIAQPRVEVPSDFDFRLRARIARARDEERGWRGALAQFWSKSFSWSQAGAAAAVLAITALSVSYYATRTSDTPSREIAKAVTSTPQTGPTQAYAPSGTSTPAVESIQNSQPVESRNSGATRAAVHAMTAIPTAAAPRTEVAQVASAELQGAQEILVYQPSHAGKPAGARSIVIPRRGQVAFGAQLASVREAGSRPSQGTIETF
jgi:hypothetical protein